MSTTTDEGASGRAYDALMSLAGPFAAEGCDVMLLHADEAWLVATVRAPAITLWERASLAERLAWTLNDRAGRAPDPDPLR